MNLSLLNDDFCEGFDYCRWFLGGSMWKFPNHYLHNLPEDKPLNRMTDEELRPAKKTLYELNAKMF
ncbi:MAG: hypothetical protein FVQ83_10970 [Chloroflexi bacterium]|nr:hypothetical protein [Chloroflexota bacterium]